jgi:outer membrane protein TolC
MDMQISIATSLSNFEDAVSGLTNKNGVSLQNNSDLIQLGVQQQQLNKALQLQNTGHLPTLVGFSSFGYTATPSKDMNLIFGANPDATPPNPGTPVTMKGQNSQLLLDGLVLGLQLNIPIFSGMSNVYKAKQLKIQQKELELQHEYMLNSLSVQARTALDNMDKAAKQVESNKKGTELAKKGYQISQTRYTSGAGTMLELNSSALSLTQAKLSYNQSIVDYLSARADFEKIVGQTP